MLLSKKVVVTAIAVTFVSLLVATTYASRLRQSAVPAPALGIEISLAKPFYIPAATSTKRMSAVVRTPIVEDGSGQEITAVKLAPVMEGDKVKVTVYALMGDANDIKNITSCKDWDSLKSVTVDTYTVGLDEEVSITKLRDYGIKFENGDLKFHVVPKKVFTQYSPLDGGGGGCDCASCGALQCCPNPGYCIGCGSCGQACCSGG